MMDQMELVPPSKQFNEKSSPVTLFTGVTVEHGLADLTEASNRQRVVELNPLSASGLPDYYMRRHAPAVTVVRSPDHLGLEPDIVSTSRMSNATTRGRAALTKDFLTITSHRSDALELAEPWYRSQAPVRLMPTTVSQLLGPVRERSAHTAGHYSASLLSVFERIRELAELPSNWDAEDADPPTGMAVAAACYLILAATSSQERLDHSIVVPITSSPIPDGGLQIEWEGPNGRIDVQTNPDGSYGYLVKWNEGRHARYEETDQAELETILALIVRVLAS
jgi:hypothetical protein